MSIKKTLAYIMVGGLLGSFVGYYIAGYSGVTLGCYLGMVGVVAVSKYRRDKTLMREP